jgi:WD40 repeat protein
VFDLSEALLSISAQVAGNVAWSPSGQQVAVGFWDPITKVWNSLSGEEIFTLAGHDESLIFVGWSPSGDRILTASDDETAMIWDATTGEQLLRFTGQGDRIWGAAWSPDGSRIATTDLNNGRVIVWDSDTGEILQTFSGHQDWVNAAAWSPDGTRILSTGYNGKAVIWDVATGDILLNLFPEDFNLNVSSAIWAKDGKRVFVQSVDGIAVFDSQTGEQLLQFPTVSLGYFISLSPDEKRILTSGNGGSAFVWDTETGAELLSYDVGGWVWAAYSPDGKQVLVGTDNEDQSSLQVFPTWHSKEELIDYAYDCCVFRELTAEERQLFGLLVR